MARMDWRRNKRGKMRPPSEPKRRCSEVLKIELGVKPRTPVVFDSSMMTDEAEEQFAKAKRRAKV